MTYAKFPFKKFGIRRLAFAKSEKCLFFKNDSCLSNCQVVFSQNPEQTTIPFTKETNTLFGEWPNE